MIGDGENDVKAGKAAGCRTALIGTEDYGQDLVATSLLNAVQQIKTGVSLDKDRRRAVEIGRM